jgi:nitrite reductase/ring-hydroxylating ferredoxin subunit
MGNFVKVASVADVPPGQCKSVSADGREIGLFNCDGKFHAIDNVCPHAGGPLAEGGLDGEVVTCPWHGWRFNVCTGVSAMSPALKVKTFEVKVEGNDVLVGI